VSRRLRSLPLRYLSYDLFFHAGAGCLFILCKRTCSCPVRSVLAFLPFFSDTPLAFFCFFPPSFLLPCWYHCYPFFPPAQWSQGPPCVCLSFPPSSLFPLFRFDRLLPSFLSVPLLDHPIPGLKALSIGLPLVFEPPRSLLFLRVFSFRLFSIVLLFFSPSAPFFWSVPWASSFFYTADGSPPPPPSLPDTRLFFGHSCLPFCPRSFAGVSLSKNSLFPPLVFFSVFQSASV